MKAKRLSTSMILRQLVQDVRRLTRDRRARGDQHPNLAHAALPLPSRRAASLINRRTTAATLRGDIKPE